MLLAAGFFPFQFRPSRVQRIQIVLRLVHFNAGSSQAYGVGGHRRILQSRAPHFENPVRVPDALLDRLQFAHFMVGEPFFRSRGRRFSRGRSALGAAR